MSPEVDGARPIAMRLERTSAVPDTTWFKTDSVRMVAATTSGSPLMDKVLRFQGKVLDFGIVSAPGDQGVKFEATGYDRHVEIWTATTTLPPSTEAQTATLSITSGKATTNNVPSLGVLEAPVVSFRSVSAWTTDFGNVKVYDAPVVVLLKMRNDSAQVRYTLDGVNPGTGSKLYNPDSGIRIDTTSLLKVAAIQDGWVTSFSDPEIFRLRARDVRLDHMDVMPWATNTYDQPVTLTLGSPTPNAEIRYTIDGSIPDRTSRLYTDAGVVIDSGVVLNAVAYSGKSERSTSVFREILFMKAQSVRFVVGRGLTNHGVALSTPTPGCAIHYTTDGTTPTENSRRYSDSLVFSGPDSLTIRAIAIPTSGKMPPPPATSVRIGPGVGPTIVDARDGQRYQTVKIGTQNWMAQNLNFQVDSSWQYHGNDADSGRKYGRVYPWAAVMNLSDWCNRNFCQDQVQQPNHRGICPDGWHVPSKEEWTVLFGYLHSGAVPAGAKLKSNTGWGDSANGTNASLFSAFPAGVRGWEGGWSGFGKYTKFWSASEYEGDADPAISFGLSSVPHPLQDFTSKGNELSVRCIEN